MQLLEARKRANPDSPASIDEDSGIVFTNYLPRDSLLHPGERAFFPALQQACADRSLIFPQVQLSKLIYPRAGIPKRQTYQNKIDRKSVDFVLCNPSTLKVQLIIELDGKSHTREDRKRRDTFSASSLAIWPFGDLALCLSPSSASPPPQPTTPATSNNKSANSFVPPRDILHRSGSLRFPLVIAR